MATWVTTRSPHGRLDTIYGGKGDDLINYSGVLPVGANNIGIQAAGNVGNDVIYGGTG